MDGRAAWRNKLYYGDNLEVMRRHIADESVDLIYLDPPFNSKATYNVLFGEKNGSQSAAQIRAFEDTWHWDLGSEAAYREIVGSGPKKLGDLIQALRGFLGTNDMMAYLVMMAIRLVEMHRVLKPTGTIYLHCDQTASHYLKLLLDGTFGHRNFIGQVIWKRANIRKATAKKWLSVEDILLIAAKSDAYRFNAIYRPLSSDYRQRFKFKDERGYYYWIDIGTHSQERLERLKAENRVRIPDTPGVHPRIKHYLHEARGVQMDNIWTDVPMLNSQAQERLGYPTQKPEALLERVIQASSNEGDLVLDPFCGCGTTVNVAERLHRRWIGIDITYLAINLISRRLRQTFPKDLSAFEVIGDPKDVSSARDLALRDRYQFQWWALDKVGARPAKDDKKKGADEGIDGWINFFDDPSGQAKRIVVQVKSGRVKSGDIRDLKGTMEREKAQIGAYVTLEEPTRAMVKEAAEAGFYVPERYPDQKYPRIQILTVEDILNDEQVSYPRFVDAAGSSVPTDFTYKRARRKSKASGPKQKPLV